MDPKAYLVFDVESVGLHGEGFAVGWAALDTAGHETGHGLLWCDPQWVAGNEAGRAWIAANIPPLPKAGRCSTVQALRAYWWEIWQAWQTKGYTLVADCPWPVEARFLAACIDDAPLEREWQGPYPLIDVASVRLAAGLDPLGTNERRPDELPIHNPEADARQSARLLLEAFQSLSCQDAEEPPNGS